MQLLVFHLLEEVIVQVKSLHTIIQQSQLASLLSLLHLSNQGMPEITHKELEEETMKELDKTEGMF